MSTKITIKAILRDIAQGETTEADLTPFTGEDIYLAYAAGRFWESPHKLPYALQERIEASMDADYLWTEDDMEEAKADSASEY